MLRSQCDGSLEHKLNFLRIHIVIASEACRILRFVFCWGCERDQTKTVENYLIDEKKMSQREYKKRFNKTMQEKIRSNPLGDEFDVTLLYACIKAACKGLADEGSDVWTKEDLTKLEYLCTAIKDIRGGLFHGSIDIDETDMERCIKKIEDLLLRILDQAGSLYKRDPNEISHIKNTLKEGISNITSTPLGCQTLDQYKKDIEEVRKYCKNVIKKDGIDELRENFMNLDSVDPVSWFAGNCELKVEAVFTRLDVVKEKRNLSHPEAVCYEDLLTLETEDAKIPSVVVIEGEAGAGKTTLTKLMMREWAECPKKRPKFRDLENFELVLHIECRNKHVSRFEDLLLLLLPKASCYLRNSDLVQAVLGLHVLLIADGLDEGSENMYKLLNEIISVCIPRSAYKLQMVLTTRPEKLSKLPSLLCNVPWVHTRLTGIASNRRAEFVSRLHEEMISQKQSTQDTQGLVDFLKQSQARIGDHYRLPLILTLLTFLWAYDPKRVNPVTTSTKLYLEFHKMIQHRLQDRLLKYEIGANAQVEKRCEEFLRELYEVSLLTIQSDDINLTETCSRRLIQTCERLDLPSDEMCAAFLALDRRWTPQGYITSLAAPHKSIMEFYACHHVFHYLFPPNNRDKFEDELLELLAKYGKSFTEIKEHLNIAERHRKQPTLAECFNDLFNIRSDNEYLLSNYQNVVIHFCGLLADKKKDALKDLAVALVELLDRAKINGARWLDVIWEADCHDVVTALVAERINLFLIIRDGHTRAALDIFPYLDTNLPVRIVLDCEVRHIPHLSAMLDKVAERDCDVELFLNHQWKDSDLGASDNLLGRLIDKRCRLSSFAGNLKDLTILPNTVEKLKFTITDDEHAKSICPELKHLEDTLNLEYLGVHIAPDVDPNLLKKLPVVKPYFKESGTIWLSNVTDGHVEWACRVARALLPKDCKYNNIRFPRSNLSMEKCKMLIRSLGEAGVKVRNRGFLMISSNSITCDQEIELRYLTRDKLHCDFYCCDESTIW